MSSCNNLKKNITNISHQYGTHFDGNPGISPPPYPQVSINVPEDVNNRRKYTSEEKYITVQYFFDHLFTRDNLSDKQII